MIPQLARLSQAAAKPLRCGRFGVIERLWRSRAHCQIEHLEIPSQGCKKIRQSKGKSNAVGGTVNKKHPVSRAGSAECLVLAEWVDIACFTPLKAIRVTRSWCSSCSSLIGCSYMTWVDINGGPSSRIWITQFELFPSGPGLLGCYLKVLAPMSIVGLSLGSWAPLTVLFLSCRPFPSVLFSSQHGVRT